ncbi:hypothetical protein [Marinimicrococcus flavescens]|uniref:Uncharacterized protein n=1 Tax=Marinimicrococcus flavescens TaxID=3031815 RepID=A0AAP4D4V1_9PROT|nr:hypothetical protein [Marinimicrococcus flavescens]
MAGIMMRAMPALGADEGAWDLRCHHQSQACWTMRDGRIGEADYQLTISLQHGFQGITVRFQGAVVPAAASRSSPVQGQPWLRADGWRLVPLEVQGGGGKLSFTLRYEDLVFLAESKELEFGFGTAGHAVSLEGSKRAIITLMRVYGSSFVWPPATDSIGAYASVTKCQPETRCDRASSGAGLAVASGVPEPRSQTASVPPPRPLELRAPVVAPLANADMHGEERAVAPPGPEEEAALVSPGIDSRPIVASGSRAVAVSVDLIKPTAEVEPRAPTAELPAVAPAVSTEVTSPAQQMLSAFTSSAHAQEFLIAATPRDAEYPSSSGQLHEVSAIVQSSHEQPYPNLTFFSYDHAPRSLLASLGRLLTIRPPVLIGISGPILDEDVDLPLLEQLAAHHESIVVVRGSEAGLGVYIGEHRVLTSLSLLKANGYADVYSNGMKYDGMWVASVLDSSLAVLDVRAEGTSVEFSKSRAPISLLNKIYASALPSGSPIILDGKLAGIFHRSGRSRNFIEAIEIHRFMARER